jgi:hypothetical protein
MTNRFSAYTASHVYPDLNAGILLHGYSAAVDWVTKDIAERAMEGESLDSDAVGYEALMSLRVRGYITDNNPAQEREYVKDLLNVLASKQMAPVDLFVSKRAAPYNISSTVEVSEHASIEPEQVAEYVQALLLAIAPKTRTRRIVRITLNLQEAGLGKDDIGSLLHVISRLSSDSKLIFEFYLRARDSYIESLSYFRRQLAKAREIEVLADRQSVSEQGYDERIKKSLSQLFLHDGGHNHTHFPLRLRWTYEAAAPAGELDGMREIISSLEAFGISTLILCRKQEMPSIPAGKIPLVGSDEYALFSRAGKFFSAPSIFSFNPFFSQVTTALSVGLDGRCSFSTLPHLPEKFETVQLADMVSVLEQECQIYSVDSLKSDADELFCLQCPYCLICGGNPFLSRQEMATYECFKVFHRKIGTILPVLSRRQYESE